MPSTSSSTSVSGGGNMVSAVLASLLQSYLGKYLELSDTSISVGSEVRLNNVRLRESAFTDLVSNDVTLGGNLSSFFPIAVLLLNSDNAYRTLSAMKLG